MTRPARRLRSPRPSPPLPSRGALRGVSLGGARRVAVAAGDGAGLGPGALGRGAAAGAGGAQPAAVGAGQPLLRPGRHLLLPAGAVERAQSPPEAQVAEQLLYERWRRNTPELREVESELHRKHVVEAWGDQILQKAKQEAAELEEKQCYEKESEVARREGLERMRQEEEQRRLEEKKQAEVLLQQIEELKLQEAEATKLKKEQENLLKQQWELENLEEERKQMEEQRKKKELGRILRHQCDVQLQRRAQQIQEELEADRKILSALLEEEEEDQSLRSARRERAVADVAWMKRVIEEQLQLEKEREAELQTIFREEAKKVWEKREEEWEREKAARDCLMTEVLAGRQRQIQEKMELNRRAQEESIKYREQLIKELEEAKELRRREKQQEEELKAARRQELEAQLTERRERRREEQQRRREEEAAERGARQRRDARVRQEAALLARQGQRGRLYSYPRAAWT
ncbi:trichoplein keratin filament-binding protein isoform X2 [Apus apus]|uniref:trichoplein keratin filament-binding protein isoform X2 n=1 Tax=Apus apus TaxID=8895 RepID=UPI0021F8B4F5|nr:trichoplein keratin filament-binding protein isoform X2 [Apus apus]